jgi:hypothetical protein
MPHTAAAAAATPSRGPRSNIGRPLHDSRKAAGAGFGFRPIDANARLASVALSALRCPNFEVSNFEQTVSALHAV